MANQHRLEIGARVKKIYHWLTDEYTIVGEIFWGYDNDGYNDWNDLHRKPNRVLTIVDDNGNLSEAGEDELKRA